MVKMSFPWRQCPSLIALRTSPFVEYWRAVSEARARVELLTQALTQELEDWRMRPLVEQEAQ
jgi:hypothetical protein